MNFKNYIKSILLVLITALGVTSCVHDDKYDEPNLQGYECQDLTANMTLKELKALPKNTEITEDKIVEAYVSSSDESGNIYKTLFVQDAPENPTEGLAISIDLINSYTKYPQGSKVYIKVKGLSIGEYGGAPQLGIPSNGTTLRIPENKVKNYIIRSCKVRANIIPKVMKLSELNSSTTALIGTLIQVDNAEFDARNLCTTFADPGTSVDKMITDPTTSVTTRVIRSSGYASFAHQIIPSGNGSVVAIYGRYGSTQQLMLNRIEDLKFTKLTRNDNLPVENLCSFTPKPEDRLTIAQIKALNTSANTTLLPSGKYIKAKVIANDEHGNIYKMIYLEDETGGIGIRINKADLFKDHRFKVGKTIYVKTSDLYIGASFGELQLGVPFNNFIGQIDGNVMYKYFYDSGEGLSNVVPVVRSISQLTDADVGRLVRINGLQFSLSEFDQQDLLYPKIYAPGGNSAPNFTLRQLESCSGEKINLSTSKFADFANADIDAGRGDVIAILTKYNNQYELKITNVLGADLDETRCDGTAPPITLFAERFTTNTLGSQWLTVSKKGEAVWTWQNFGNPAPSVVINGYTGAPKDNEDYLISKEILLTGGSQYILSFDSDVRYNGAPLQVFVTANYTGDPSTTTWKELSATWDTNTGAFNTWVKSGAISLNEFAGQKVRIVFKYTSNTTAANTWQLDNIMIKRK